MVKYFRQTYWSKIYRKVRMRFVNFFFSLSYFEVKKNEGFEKKPKIGRF